MDAGLKSLVAEWMIQGLPFEVFWLDRSGRIVFANEAVGTTLGYTRAELEQLTIYDINPRTSSEKWANHWERVRRQSIDHFKTYHRRRDGITYPVEVYAQFFSNNGKNYICSLVRDISDSNLYRAFLEQTEQAAGIGGWEWQLDDLDVLVTSQTLRIFGVTEPDALQPDRLLRRIDEAHRTPFSRALHQAVRNRESYRLDILMAGKDQWVRTVGQPIVRDEQVVRVRATFQDITLEKEQERSLQLARTTLDNALDMVYWIGPDGRISDVNHAASQALGYTPEELRNRAIFDIDPAFPPTTWSQHWLQIRDRQSFSFETTHQRRDGTLMPVEVKVNYLNFQGKEYNCAIVRDISERKERELQLLEAFEEISRLKDQYEVENEYLQEEINLKHDFQGIIYSSAVYRAVLEKVEQVGPSDTTVLITGETGTGKELLARAVHQLSTRRDRPLIKVNCAALPKDLIESELFGHRKGAFTGALKDKLGKFELAHRGTLFLDEIGELPLALQPKLLRVLQDGEFDRIGDTATTQVDVRIISATNRDLQQMVREGKFREDLYYRLHVFPIHNLPLRERTEDIPLLAQHFLEKFAARTGKPFRRISGRALKALQDYPFPGNIRELENLIERAVILESGPTLKPGSWLPKTDFVNEPGQKEWVSLEETMRRYIIRALRQTEGRVSGPRGAAQLLGINPKTLFARMKKLDIQKAEYL